MNETISDFATGELNGVGITINTPSGIRTWAVRNVAMHAHLTFEMHTLLEGIARIETQKGSYLLNSGEAVLIPPNIYHKISNVTEHFRLQSFGLQLYKSSSIPEAETNESREKMDALRAENILLLDSQPDIISCVERMVRAQHSRAYANNSLLNLYAAELLVYLLRAAPKGNTFTPGGVSSSKRGFMPIKLQRMDKIEEYLAVSYANADIHEMAKMLSLSEQHLRRILKVEYGMSFSTLVNNQRINICKQLLCNTDKTITEIWQITGFNSPQCFSMVFKKCVGCTPSSYREKNRGKDTIT